MLYYNLEKKFANYKLKFVFELYSYTKKYTKNSCLRLILIKNIEEYLKILK